MASANRVLIPLRMLAAGAALTACGSAWAQTSGDAAPPALTPPLASLLPPFGTDPTAPDLRDRLSDVFDLANTEKTTSAEAGPAWQFNPQITVSEEYTDNASAAGGPPIGVNGHTGSDFITLIQPQLQILNTSDRLRVNVTYDPTAQIYAENSSYSQFRQDGNALALATLFPELLYFDLRGSITQQPVFGGFGAVGSTTLPPDQQETLSQIAATPYINMNFGDAGTLQAGGGYIYSATEAPNDLNQTFLQLGGAGFYSSQFLSTGRAFANFTTGDELSRFRNVLGTDDYFYDGSGAMQSARRVLVTDDASYAVNRFVAALAEVGYQNLNYPNDGFSHVGGVWAAGVRLTPSENSTITLEYRHIDGIDAPYAYGTWQVTPRIRVFGGYSEGISSFEQDQQNTLISGTATATGVAASTLIAAPVLNSINYFGGNQSLNQTRRLDASAVYLLDRDSVTASFDYQRSTVVGNPAGLSTSQLGAYGLTPAFLTQVLQHGIPSYVQGFDRTFLEDFIVLERFTSPTSTNLVGGLTWQHDLRPDLMSQIYVGYSETRQAEVSSTSLPFALVSATLTYDFNDKLSGHATFAGNYHVGSSNNIGVPSNYNYDDSTFTVGVIKRF
jgi:uncharacterized protein (PEP-CTERM system associated)